MRGDCSCRRLAALLKACVVRFRASRAALPILFALGVIFSLGRPSEFAATKNRGLGHAPPNAFAPHQTTSAACIDVQLVADSISATKTKCGYGEFCDISTPPKRYLTQVST